MSITGIDSITYGVEDLELCRRFFVDWGLQPKGENDFETLNGCEVKLRRKDDPSLPPAMEPGSTLREVIWGTDDDTTLPPRVDPNGLALKFRKSRKREIDVRGVPANGWGLNDRVDRPAPVYERAQPVEVGHLVLFTDRLDKMERFYVGELGFHVSDRYPGRGLFLRSTAEGGHHDVFVLQTPTSKPGVNHVAFAVRDLYEVFGGGMHVNRRGWTTEIGPGRHPVSSAFFWYVKCPAGGLAEYYADEDYVTRAWRPRELTPSPELFAEWAITGGIDGNTRRQASGPTVEAGTAGRAARD
jgi:catechol 2,3-dioxygenase-like lactoylglutathione lyase family enzyme